MDRATLWGTCVRKEQVRIMHWHFGIEWTYLAEGTAEVEVEEKTYSLSAGQLLMVDRLRHHVTSKNSEDYCSFNLIVQPEEVRYSPFSSKRLEQLCNSSETGAVQVNLGEDAPEVERIFQYFTSHFLPSEKEYDREYARCLLEQLLILMSRHYTFPVRRTAAEERILTIRDEIDREFAEDISVSLLAQRHFVSEDHLIHEFRRVTGYSPGQYILMNRLTFAHELLTSTPFPIPVIAHKSGFGDVNHFIRSFKKQYGVPPGQYRKGKRPS